MEHQLKLKGFHKWKRKHHIMHYVVFSQIQKQKPNNNNLDMHDA
jgi:hypothetical protein